MFADLLKKEFNEKYVFGTTENGALGYKTTTNGLVDFNFKLPSYRTATEKTIIEDFLKALEVDEVLAIRYLFYMRDVRGGLGERNTFRVILKFLVTHSSLKKDSKVLKNLLLIIPEYGRWDDLLFLYGNCGNKVNHLIEDILLNQLKDDMILVQKNKPISLLAKWMPSIQYKGSRQQAKRFANAFNFTERQYRKMLSKLRGYLKVVETKMSKNLWEEIDYSQVPSKANVKYNSAFLRHDESRRRNFLSKVEKGEAKINSSVNFPHDIVGKYISTNGYYRLKEDKGLEVLWKSLPNFDGGDNILVVADTSGSMRGNPLQVCYSLAIYFAERAKGQFNNKAILFSAKPKYLELNQKTLRDKLEYLLKYNECSNTDIEATFDLILNTAVRNNLKQEDLPKALLVISDMEFDDATYQGWGYDRKVVDKRLFEVIENKYKKAGYEIPKMIFWNVASRTNTIPVTQHSNGVALVSGFSPNIVRMVLSNELDPFNILKEQLMNKRYDKVESIIKDSIK